MQRIEEFPRKEINFCNEKSEGYIYKIRLRFIHDSNINLFIRKISQVKFFAISLKLNTFKFVDITIVTSKKEPKKKNKKKKRE